MREPVITTSWSDSSFAGVVAGFSCANTPLVASSVGEGNKIPARGVSPRSS